MKRDCDTFKFPVYHRRSRRWVISSRRADLEKKPFEKLHRSNVKCEKHFESCCFKETKGKRKLLKNDAVPSIFAVPNPPPKQTPRPPPKERIAPTLSQATTSGTETDTTSNDVDEVEINELGDSGATHHEKKSLKSKLLAARTKSCSLKKKLKTMTSNTPTEQSHPVQRQEIDFDSLHSMIKNHLPQAALQLVLTQIRTAQANKYGRRWTASEKAFALALYNTSQKAYSMIISRSFFFIHLSF